MIHIHFYHRVGNWNNASWGLKACRCGATKLYDLWGFAFEHSDEELQSITDKLAWEASKAEAKRF